MARPVWAICLFLLAALSGCSSAVEQIRTLETSDGTAFDQALAKAYRDLALHEADEEFDWPAADHFASKGLAAAGGETVLPDEITSGPYADKLFLGAGRQRLMAVLDEGAREAIPADVAQAQAMFDCWLYKARKFEAEITGETPNGGRIGLCRDSFMAIMKQMERRYAEVAFDDFSQWPIDVVLFDWDQARIRPDAQAVIEKILAEAKAKGTQDVRLSVTGHADLSGPEDYNMVLSMRRAQAVRDALIAGGVPAEAITISARGESEPAVPTGDGAREQANRRVEVFFQ